MQAKAERTKIGIGGWEHDVLDEALYSCPGLDARRKLEEYARFFDAVEVRPTFWDDTLGAEAAREWIAAVRESPSFLFSVKLHAAITHRKTLVAEPIRRMRALLQELASSDRLGAVLAQFPYAFTNTSANRFHLVRIAELFRGFPLHVEFRHQSWNTPQLLPFLEEAGVSPVSADVPRVRQLMPFTTRTLGDTAYLRLHGRNERGWLTSELDARYDYLYNAREIQELRRRIEAVHPTCRRILVIFNTTTGAKAVANALQLASALREGKAIPVPPPALEMFPFLAHIAPPDRMTEGLFEAVPYRAVV
jgi:uncharacterized protein YecE (DUF72 family)